MRHSRSELDRICSKRGPDFFPIPYAPRASPLERRPQAPRPEAPVRARLVDGDRVVPADDRVVEQVQPKTEAVAAQRIALARDVVVRGTSQIQRLLLGPRSTHVVEEESVERWKGDRQDAELEAPDERKTQLGVGDGDTAAEQLYRAAVRRICTDDWTGEIEG